jgi:hypothetical protein
MLCLAFGRAVRLLSFAGRHDKTAGQGRTRETVSLVEDFWFLSFDTELVISEQANRGRRDLLTLP